jgi:hypothetical protein
LMRKFFQTDGTGGASFEHDALLGEKTRAYEPPIVVFRADSNAYSQGSATGPTVVIYFDHVPFC